MNRFHYQKSSYYDIQTDRKLHENHASQKMSFEELCPIWAEKLNSGLTEKDKILLAHDSKYCIVGEAWQFSGRYTGYYIAPLIPFIGCWTCIKFGRRFGKMSRIKNIQKNKLEPLIMDFMNHWTEKHASTREKEKN